MFPGEVICENYQIVKKVGQGSFGFVYKVKHRTTHQLYALKTDQKSVTKMELQNQVQVLKIIQKRYKKLYHKKDSSKNAFNLCLNHFFSQQSSNKMLMPLFGQNMFNIFQKCNKRFDSHTIYEVVKRMLKNIQEIHELGFIHRDIKPQNFVIGEVFEQKNRHDDGIYLVDFGLAKPYKTFSSIEQKQHHLPYEIGRKIRGTPMYMSINVMLGIQPSRRDDLQSLMYILVFFLKGRLPWHGLKITKKDFDDLIIAKISIHPDQLFSNLPTKLKEIFIYIRKLKFEEQPDYQKIQDAFQSILLHRNQKIEEQYKGKYQKYCWEVIYQKQNLLNDQKNNQKDWIEKYIKQREYTLLD